MRATVTSIALPLITAASVACHGSTEPQPADACRGTNPFTLAGTRPAGTLTARASSLTGRPFGIRVSSSGMVFVTQQDANSVARLSLSNLAANAAVPVGHDPGDVVFTRDGSKAIVSNFFDGTVQVLDAAAGSTVHFTVVSATNAYRLALSPNDARLYVTSTDGFLSAVDPTGQLPSTTLFLGGQLQGLALDRAGGSLIASNATGGVWRVDACTLTIAASASLPNALTQDVAYSPDESRVYVANENGFIEVLDATTLTPVRRMVLPSLRPFGLAVTSDGSQLYVTSPTTGQVGVIDAVTGATSILAVGGIPRRIAFDATGSVAVISNEGNWVDVVR